MRMNRRDFLKGMLAIAGSTLLPSQLVEAAGWVGVDPDVSLTGEMVRPEVFGRLGRVRLNEKWFSLEDASINLRRKYEPRIWIPDPERAGQHILAGKEQALVDSEYEIEFFVREDTVELMRDVGERGRKGDGEVDFLVDGRAMTFRGKGWVSTTGVAVFPSRGETEDVLFDLTLVGVNSVIRAGDDRWIE